MSFEITSRKRIIKALNHEEPDEVPVDFGATMNSSIVKEGYINLCEYLDIPAEDPKFINRMMRSVEVKDQLLDYFSVDVRGVFPETTAEIEWIEDDIYRDHWGLEWEKNKYYYELRKSPLAGNISESDIDRYDWPDPKNIEIEDLNKKIDYLRGEYDSALIMSLPSCFIHTSQYLRGFEEWYLDCAANPELLTYLFDRILEINLEISRKILQQAGDRADIIKFADDLGSQRGLQISPEFFRTHIKPRFKRYVDQIREFVDDPKVFIHSCGSIEPILTDFIEIGIDIINPVQISAEEMAPEKLKNEYGDQLSFWGAVDTQKVLRTESPAAVRKEVERLVKILGEGGGFVLGAVHNIQPDVPPENIEAMFLHAKEFSKSFY
ncbi:uroporphyrinogen decarboxylase family protein [Halarsenatibacter silvermanii]|uniref:Uroporphyrinogen decarboxylase n=1 Tax=Halarsenatibacter silvermanii TaxID=321763 RepID=A0A1G9SFN3_9FIRM|nr:uroporphyrinogen decarboxylase family protein [Halarsenatibacter silvermanii]SDM34288.1 uroporphyrinogen decarboxylase [Halarsenatibacter silvermanii]